MTNKDKLVSKSDFNDSFNFYNDLLANLSVNSILHRMRLCPKLICDMNEADYAEYKKILLNIGDTIKISK